MRKINTPAQNHTDGDDPVLTPRRAARRMARYVLVRLGTILLTIFGGVFATIVVANQAGTIDFIVPGDIDELVLNRVYSGVWADLTPEQLEQERLDMQRSAGLHLPWLPRHLRWLWNAMSFQWGESLAKESEDISNYMRMSAIGGPGSMRFRITNIIATHLPNTLLLVGTADLIIFLVGLPLALHLGRRTNQWADRLFSLLAPLASIPSWVHGILLVLVFSIWLKLLPYDKMFDMLPPETAWGYITVVARHMLLPVLAILLNLFLQCVTAWRTFFYLYSNEDYVELAVAKGVASGTLERRHILRPTLPYIITSFALTLIGFWQMTTALEYFFAWPGIGLLYVEALNHYDIVVAIGIVVIFAYLLGLIIFILDIAYAVVDPRIRLGENSPRLRESSRPRSLFARQRRRAVLPPSPAMTASVRRPSRPLVSIVKDGWRSTRQGLAGFGAVLRRLMRLPSGFIGLLILLGLVLMSLYALVFFSGARGAGEMTKKGTLDPYAYRSTPHNALPAWINAFRARDLPPTLTYTTLDGTAQKSVDGDRVSILFTIEFPYGGFPQEMYLLFDAPYQEKAPFASMTWTKPDGEQVVLKQGALDSDYPFDFSLGIPRRTLADHGLFPLLRSSSDAISGQGGYPAFYVLFSSPQVSQPVNLAGTYSLQIDATTFEPGTDIDARLILVGQVYGVAGTDNYGNNLLIPLVWGAPSALAIGLLGAFLTTIVSMVIAAVAAWNGGWVDSLVQRLSEASMVLPFLAIGIMLRLFFDISLGIILLIVVLLNALGSPVKAYRAAFLQVREAPYIEAARIYGAGNARIIFRYLIPRISRVLVPQLTFLLPGYIFLDATLAIFGVMGSYTSWGGLIYVALRTAPLQRNYFWLAEPIGLLLLTGLGFALLGSALERVLDTGQVADLGIERAKPPLQIEA